MRQQYLGPVVQLNSEKREKNKKRGPQRSREDKNVIFTTLIAWSEFNPHPGHVVTFLNKKFYDDYFSLMALPSSKFSVQEF